MFRSFGEPLVAIQASGLAKRFREYDDVVAVVSSKHTMRQALVYCRTSDRLPLTGGLGGREKGSNVVGPSE